MKRQHIPINVLRFSFRDYLDEEGVYAGLNKFFASSWIFKFVIEWIFAIRNNVEIRSIQNTTNIIEVADK